MLLFLRTVFWTIIVPGAVTIYLPHLILARGGPVIPREWGIVQCLSLLPITAGATILLRCIWDFAAVGRGTLSPFDAPKKLVIVGLYRYVRNPMYIGVLMVLAGEASFFESVPLLEYSGAWFVLVNLVVFLHEEPTLRRRFGESYESYCRCVHRWLPGRRFNDAV